MPQFLLLLALGPVQEFIVAGRRCRDLQFGSKLLSHLAAKAACELKECGAQLVFPPPDFEPRAGVANKILVVVEGEPQTLLQSVRGVVWQELQRLSEEVWTQFGRESALETAKARAQIADLLEWQSIAVPIEDGDDGFQKARILAEQLLAARKNLRDFAPVSWGDQSEKSVLDGNREVVATVREHAKTEKLCGVALLKRKGKIDAEDGRFFSTSHIAAQDVLAGWEKHHDAALFADFVRDCGRQNSWTLQTPRRDSVFDHYDGEHLFDEPGAGDFWKAWTKNDFPGARPLPYYAILVADGDDIGEAIAPLDWARCTDFSRALSQFSTQVEGIVREARGELIYAGGDDVTALLPLHSALGAAKQLHDLFGETFGELNLEKPPTLSAGLALVHHQTPLSQALQMARNAETRAKKVDGKDALAIIQAKRGGAPIEIAGKWGDFDGRLNDFIELAGDGDLASGLAYEWRDLALNVGGLPPEALRALARQSLQRKAQGTSSKFRKTETASKVFEHLETGVSLENLANELVVASLFAGAKKLAQGEKTL